MVEVDKGIAVCISSASPRLRGPKAKQRQTLRHCARALFGFFRHEWQAG